MLVAAAYAVRGDLRHGIGMAVHRLMSDTEMRGAHELADQMAGWIVRRSYRDPESRKVIPRVLAADLAMTVLKLRSKPACLECGGRGHPLFLHAPTCDESRDCPACKGTGKIPVAKLVRTEHVKYAQWLMDELDLLCRYAMSDMKKIAAGGRIF